MGKPHEEKYRDFIINRCFAVIDSCEKYEQLDMAIKYCWMFRKVYSRFNEELINRIWDFYQWKREKLHSAKS